MRKTLLNFTSCAIISSLFFLPLYSSIYASTDNSAPIANIQNSHKIQFLILEGTPYERGLTHGKTFKKEIKTIISLWKEDIYKDFKKDPNTIIKDFLDKTNYIKAIEKWTPELLDEVKGISEGSGIDFNTILAFQFMDEFWVNIEGIEQKEHCSALGIQAQGKNPTIIAQNMDLECFRAGYQVLFQIKYKDSAMESFVLSCVGLIGLNGMNNRGIGVCCNSLCQLSNCRDGLPVSFIIRGILQKEKEKDVIDFITSIKHASGQNYLIGTPEHIYDFECASNKISRLIQPKLKNMLLHTNVPLINNSYNDDYKKMILEENETEKNDQKDSMIRLASLEKRLTEKKSHSLIKCIEETLRSRDDISYPICRMEKDNQNIFTFSSIIMILSQNPELLISCGPPNINPYEKYSFAKKF